MFYRLLLIIIFILLPSFIYGESSIPEYNLHISFEISDSKIIGHVSIPAQRTEELLFFAGNLKIREVRLNNRQIDFTLKDGFLKALPSHDGNLKITYEGVFKGNQTDQGSIQNIIDERGISLTGIWYPQREGLFRYKLSVILPLGYEAVSEAEKIEGIDRDGKREFIFEFIHPLDGINFIATNRYRKIKEVWDGIEVYAYFFPEDIGLAKTYIDYAKKYLKFYEGILGKYPYRRFSIVENFLPTGYSMPTFTLLGQDVVRLPFIVETSLGHEILHQWFGNLVYVDYEKGNWAEGLTTYLADHLYEEQKGRGWEYRKQTLVDYRSYVNEKNEFPLKDFMGRVDFQSRSIGYGKAAMVFHMLKNIVGEEIFFRSLRNLIEEKTFQKAAWDDLKGVFERNYRNDLRWFFSQWVEEKGIPEIILEDVRLRRYVRGETYEVSFNITQKGKIYRVDIPLSFYSSSGLIKRDLYRIDKAINSFKITLDDKPERVIMDEDYDILRRLTEREFPPVIARLLGDEKIIIVPSVSKNDIYRGIIDAFREKKGVEKKAEDIRDSDIKSSSLLILGLDNPVIRRLFGSIQPLHRGGFGVIVKNNLLNPEKVIAVIYGESKEDVDAAFKKVFRYGKYGILAFERGKNIYKGVMDSQRGVVMETAGEIRAIDTSKLMDLRHIIDSVSNKKIIYVGETHDRFSHHHVQLEIIRGLHRKNKKLAIGMEMFQMPFQKALDDYIARRIEEREFLKNSEYFKRWGFDYNLYKPILDYARAEGIPVAALNMEREIIRKVSRGGVESLSDEEKKLIPEMDLSDTGYMERLKKVFERHPGGGERSFEYFYQSQILWDESMSMSIDEFLKRNPDYQMVVLAGSGHLEYGSGIPKRTFRRNGYDYAIILNDSEIKSGIADYIVFPETIEGITSPKLMVMLKEEQGRVIIEGFAEDSISEKAGLQKSDVIISLDGLSMGSVDDVKIQLFYKRKGETVKVKILRKGIDSEGREMEFEMVL